jgi:hypothetical protein
MQFSCGDVAADLFSRGPGRRKRKRGRLLNEIARLAFDRLNFFIGNDFPAFELAGKPRNRVFFLPFGELG